MSKYYKADEVINLLAAEYYTKALAEGVDVKERDFKEVAIHNTKHLPTIDIVHCKDCKNVTYKINPVRTQDVFYACCYSEIQHDGEVHSLREWSEILGIKLSTLTNRYYRGDRGEHLFRTVIERENAPSVVSTTEQSSIVHCKDCKHNPKYTKDFAFGRCVCCCEDDWYGYEPEDNFFCGHGERIEE